MQQQRLIDLHGSSFKQGLPQIYSNDTSQVDNFIFQNINRMSNQASQDGFYQITPQRDELMLRNNKGAQKRACGTNGINSRNASSNAIHQESEKTSYQGACRILNLQQPLF